MDKVEATEARVFSSSGFRIATSPCELEAVRDNRAYDSLAKGKRLAAVILSILFACIYYTIEFTRIESRHPISIVWMLPRLLDGQLLGLKSLIWTQLIVIPAIPLLVVLEMLNSGSVNLKCTQYAIQTTRVVHGKARKTFSFPVNEVTQFQYVEEPNPFNGRSRYLSFVAGGKLIKCLTGLKRAEAKLILNELDRMGFDVVRTPAMSITVQGEQSAGRPGPGDRSSPR